jgi:hypothetical protein
MTAFAQGLGLAYDYEFPGPIGTTGHVANSNATVLSVLNAVGVDVRTISGIDPYDPFQHLYGFPGAALSDGYGGLPTLLGSSSGPTPERIVAAPSHTAGLALLGRDTFDDHLIGTRFADEFYGEQQSSLDATTDTVSYEPPADPNVPSGHHPATKGVTATLTDSGEGLGYDGAAGDLYFGIENVTGSAYGDTLGEEDSGENSLAGAAGDDRLTSTAGDDRLDGGAGDDLLVSESSGATTFVFGEGYGHDVIANRFSGSELRDTTGDEVFLINLDPGDIEIWQDGLIEPQGFVGGESNGVIRIKTTGETLLIGGDRAGPALSTRCHMASPVT